MFSLPCEIIAACVDDNCATWIMLAIANDNFMRYTIENRKQFINLFTVIEEDEDSIVYMLFNRFHREDDLPAVIQNNCNEWWINGMRHRDINDIGEALPALVYDDTQEWWWRGMRHRNNDKPAVVSDSVLEWYTNDTLIRSECIKKNLN